MNELHFANRVRQHLNRSTHDISPDILDRLATARGEALARQKAAATNPVLAGIGHFAQLHGERFRLRHFLLALAVAAAAGVYAHWQADQIIADMEETDSALLTEEAPVEVFVDKGFAAWLKNSPAH